MDKASYLKLLKDLQEQELSIVGSKGEEYTHGNQDRLASFKEAATFTGMTPLQVCLVYMTKHYQAIADYVRTGNEGSEGVWGRVLDLRVYASLLMALANEDPSYSRSSGTEWRTATAEIEGVKEEIKGPLTPEVLSELNKNFKKKLAEQNRDYVPPTPGPKSKDEPGAKKYFEDHFE